MDDRFKIFLQNLTDGRQEKIRDTVLPDFLDVHENDLAFKVPVTMQGEVGLMDGTVVLKLTIETEATLSCSICNEDVQVKIEISNFYHTQDVVEIKNGKFDFREALREAILLTIPMAAECREGECPEREDLKKFFKGKT